MSTLNTHWPTAKIDFGAEDISTDFVSLIFEDPVRFTALGLSAQEMKFDAHGSTNILNTAY